MASSYFMLKMIKRKRNLRRKLTEIAQEQPENKTNINIFKDKQCRVCLKAGSIPIFGDVKSEDISDTIKKFGDIEIHKEDNYPKYICEACNFLLQSAVLFRKTARESDKYLRQHSLELTDEVNDNQSCENINDLDTWDYHTCDLCKLNFKTLEEYNVHKSSRQHRNVRIQCTICFGLLTPQLYKRHLARHQSASHLICEICGKMYRKDNLVRHLQLHSFELPYRCQICPYRGRFMESLKIHMKTHTGIKPFSCDKCQLRFLTRSNLNRHLLTHRKDRPFKCSECGRGFHAQRDVDVHFKSDHAGVKDFGCRMCGNKYGTRKALMKHELRVHKRSKMAKGRMPLYLRAEFRKPCDGT